MPVLHNLSLVGESAYQTSARLEKMSNKAFTSDVQKVERKILQALYDRWTINVNKENGVARWPANTDYVHPCVSVTRDEIKELAERSTLRDVFVDKLYAGLEKRSGVVVERAAAGGIKVCISPDRAKENEFASFNSLMRKNEREIAEDPELADDPY